MDQEKEVVKTEALESTPEAKPESQSSDSQNVDSTDRPIPYARFKEKVTEVKDLKRAVEKLAAEKELYGQQIAQQYQSYYESELAKVKRMGEQQTDYSYTQPVEDQRVGAISQEVNTLKNNIQKLQQEAETYKLQNQMGGLKPIYPEMDEEHVFSIKRLKPDWSLEECAEYSHKHFEEKINGRVRQMIEKKKEAAKKPVFGDGSKINLKPEERPKNLKEARARLSAHLESFEG
jgi:hypothetical protein